MARGGIESSRRVYAAADSFTQALTLPTAPGTSFDGSDPLRAAGAAGISGRTLAGAGLGIAASAALLAAAAPGIGDRPVLVFVAFWPWLASLRALGPVWAALSGLLFGMAYIIPGRWDSFASALAANAIQGAEQALLNSLFFFCFAVPFALFGALDAWRRRRLALSPGYAALWRAAVLASLVCGLWSPFAYTPAGFIVDFPLLLPVAALIGEVLLVILIVWPAAVLAEARRDRLDASLRRLFAPALALLLAGGYGSWQIRAHDAAQARGEGLRLDAMAVHLDLPHFASSRLLDRNRAGASLSALELSRQALLATPACELVVWPETPVDPAAAMQVCARADALAQILGRPLLAQCYRNRDGERLITAEWFDGTGAPPPWHAKSSLVPGYERPLWGEASIRSGIPGTVFTLSAGRSLVPALCYELHAGPQIRLGVLAGAQFIVHMASFTPFARHPVDRWDLGMARIRAAEHRRPILRSANRGAAGWIDAMGRVQAMSPRLGSQADCLAVWSPGGGVTPYSRIGRFAAFLPGLLALLLVCLVRSRLVARA